MQEEKIDPIRNWSEYNKALVERGNIAIWIEKKLLKTGSFLSIPI